MPNQKSRERKRLTIWDWTGLYIGLAIILHLLTAWLLILLWPTNSPIAIWDLLTGLIASAIVAILAGVITITIGNRSAHDLENATVDAITERLEARLSESLSSPLTSCDVMRSALASLLRIGEADDKQPLVVVEIDPGAELWDKTIVELLNERLAKDAPTWLILPVAFSFYGGLEEIEPREREFWTELLKDIEPEKRFVSRNFCICPVESPNPTAAIRVEGTQTNLRHRAHSSLVTFFELTGQHSVALGMRTAIDERVSEIVAEELSMRIWEPTSPYGNDRITLDDFRKGKMSGIPITRSLVTSQILIAAKQSITIGSGQIGTRTLGVVTPGNAPGVKAEFKYAGDMFLPPTHQESRNHSGSVIGRMLEDKIIDVEGKRILEIGCGPGFLTIEIAKRLGPVGQLVSVDLSDRAIAVANLNLGSTIDLVDRVTFLKMDCLELEWEEDDVVQTLSLLIENSPFELEMVLIELPLLPYRGARHLHAVERPYMENTNGSSYLTPTISKLVQKLAPPSERCGVELLLPVCAENDDDVNEIILELEGLCAPTFANWQLIPETAKGFIRCLRFR